MWTTLNTIKGYITVKIKSLSAVAAAMALATAPVALNAESFDRGSAPVEGESELAGGGAGLLVVAAVAAISVGIFLANTDDDGVSA